MTVLTLALLAGSQPAAPRLAPVHQIGPQSRRQSPHTPCAPLVRTDALTLTWQKADRHKRSAPPSSSHTPWPNPHSACGTAAAPLPAISCLGAFRPPAARARGEVRHCRQPKTCTLPAVSKCSKTALFDHLVGAGQHGRWHVEAKRFGGLEVDHQLIFGRSLHRQVARFFAPEDAINVAGRASV